MDIFSRLAQGPGSMQPQDYDDWNQMVGASPREKFGRSAYQAIQQVDPDEYYRHVAPGVDGTDPLGALPPEQRGGLASTLLNELFRRGINPREISQGAGVRSLDPNSMSPDDLANILQWTRQNNPKAFGRVAAEYQEQPDILQSLLGNKALMALLAGIGSKLLMERMSRGEGGRQGGGGFPF